MSALTDALDIIQAGLNEATRTVGGWSPLNQIAVGLRECYALVPTLTLPPPTAAAPSFPAAQDGIITLPDVAVGQPFSYQFTVDGEQPVTVALEGATAGVVNPGGGFWDPATLTLSGVPVLVQSYAFVFLATNAAGMTLVTVRLTAH